MAELISGPSMVLTWVYSAGTQTFAGDYRTCVWNPSIAWEDVGAGSDTSIGRAPTLKDASCTIQLLQQTGGTALAAAIQIGQAGTLTIQPEGTASNKRKITFPAYVDKKDETHPYANVATLDLVFIGSSTLAAYTDGTN